MSQVDLAPLRTQRPHRADAARNFDALQDAAREVFTEFGADAPMDEVARRAGVSIATLYRNFPTREQLLEHIYVTEVEAVCRAAEGAADKSPWDGLTGWLHRFVDYVATKRAVATGLDRNSAVSRACSRALHDAGGPLLDRAQRAGVVRKDVDIDGVMRLVMAFTAVNFTSDEQRAQMLSVAFDGLRPRANDTPESNN